MIRLCLAAALYGLVSGFLFRRFVRHDALRQSVNRMLAHVISFRLFADEPRLIFRAQKELALENLRLLRLTALPLIASAMMLALSWTALDRSIGRSPVRSGESAILTLPLGSALPDSSLVQAETPPVRIPRLGQISWQVKVLRENSLVTVPSRPFGISWFLWFLAISTFTAIAIGIR